MFGSVNWIFVYAKLSRFIVWRSSDLNSAVISSRNAFKSLYIYNKTRSDHFIIASNPDCWKLIPWGQPLPHLPTSSLSRIIMIYRITSLSFSLKLIQLIMEWTLLWIGMLQCGTLYLCLCFQCWPFQINVEDAQTTYVYMLSL